LYRYEFFKGTDQNYGIWIDMNEPSVNNLEDNTMVKNVYHILGDSNRVLHRDVHNCYGHMMAKATYEGLIERDLGGLRPFVLTRSAFLGSQKFAAKWTGDNRATYAELHLSIN
jgi:alpha-glucosidase (family GH31 glycosyl hydrolase)